MIFSFCHLQQIVYDLFFVYAEQVAIAKIIRRPMIKQLLVGDVS